MRAVHRSGLPRWIDASLAAAVLAAASPLMLAIAALVKLTSKGPILYSQVRVGAGGQSFVMRKFRTMAVSSRGPKVTARDDVRMTSVGRVLRKLKLDELPELWNVVRGDMALVGPRPEVPDYVDWSDPVARSVLRARPGVTDPMTLQLRNEEELLAAVPGDREAFYRARLRPFKERGYRDYLTTRSWFTDLLVLARSVFVVLAPGLAPSISVQDIEMGSQPPRSGPVKAADRFLPYRRPFIVLFQAALVALLIVRFLYGFVSYPPSVFVIDAVLLILLLGGARVLFRLPGEHGQADGTAHASQMRSLAIEDLLARAPIGLDRLPLERLIEGRRVLVTGAGGSIGSELCRQIASFRPATLVLYERYEHSLYTIANDLADRGLSAGAHALLGDVTDERRLDAVMAEHRPEIVFHAAAHKHVPLMEANPCEAVKNNVIGTRLTAAAAERHGVDRFILISTDKAVNPSSVMGATKRVDELIVRLFADRGRTGFVTVRFGNVLGSSGSLVPRFLDQIRAGGPVTVTHPEMRRFFMLTSEAVQLVLHTAALGRSSGTYVLEMGEPVSVLELARNLIQLAGYIPGQEIPIAITGLRPGEKLCEELVGDGERVEPSPIPDILRVRSPEAAPNSLEGEISRLEDLALAGDADGVLDQLGRIVPSFRSTQSRALATDETGAPALAASV